jgi:hypothetical protein
MSTIRIRSTTAPANAVALKVEGQSGLAMVGYEAVPNALPDHVTRISSQSTVNKAGVRRTVVRAETQWRVMDPVAGAPMGKPIIETEYRVFITSNPNPLLQDDLSSPENQRMLAMRANSEILNAICGSYDAGMTAGALDPDAEAEHFARHPAVRASYDLIPVDEGSNYGEVTPTP